MAASALARTFQASLSSRTIFVKCAPPPANFTERRAVLRALQQAGNASLEVFKKLEDSSSFIAVTSSPEMANKLVAESPMKRTLVGQDSTATAAFSTLAWGATYRSTITDPIDLVPTPATADSSSTNESGLSRRDLTIRVFPANADYDHKRIVARNRLRGPWPTSDGRKETFMMAALKTGVPSGAMCRALCDWETGGQLGTNGSTGDSTLDVFGHNVSKRMFAEERSRRREYRAKLPDVMKSLRAVAEGRAAMHEEADAADVGPWSDGIDHDASGAKP